MLKIEHSNNLPSGWANAALEDVCAVIQGQSPPGETYNTARDGMPFLQGKAEFGSVYPEAVKWCTAPTRIAAPDDILISIRAPVGPTNLCQVESCIGRGLAAIRCPAEMPAKYILYAMRATEEELRLRSTGTTFDAIRGGDLRAHTIPLAPVAEQHRIVAEIEKQFSRLDASVAALERVRDNLKRYRESVLHAACEGRLVESEAKMARTEGRQYESAGELLERILKERRQTWEQNNTGRSSYKEPTAPDVSELPDLPEGWAWATMPQLGELGRGKSRHRPRNDPRLLGGPHPFIQTGDIRLSGGLVTKHSRTYSDFGLSQSRLWPSGTLCITIAANIADTGILSYEACFPDSVVGFISQIGQGLSKFLELFIRTRKDEIQRFAPATAQKNINLRMLSEIAVPLPPLNEQLRIVAEVERRLLIISEAEAAVDASLNRAERLRQSVLKQAFIGHLAPQDQTDEPASELLERVRAARAAAQASRIVNHKGQRNNRRKTRQIS